MWKDYSEHLRQKIEKRKKWLELKNKPAKQALKEIDLYLGKKSKFGK